MNGDNIISIKSVTMRRSGKGSFDQKSFIENLNYHNFFLYLSFYLFTPRPASDTHPISLNVSAFRSPSAGFRLNIISD